MIEVKSLKISVKDTELVKDTNFELKKSEILGIVGESGSGKSLTLFAIMGLLNRDIYNLSGSVNFLNENLLELKERDFAKKRLTEIAMIYQNPFNTLSPVEKIESQIKRVYRIKKEKEDFEKLRTIFEKLGLNIDYLKKFPHELSGGEIQRVLIAISILFNPKVLLCDEITTSLDSESENEIVNLILKLKAEMGLSVIFVTHDLELSRKICDRFIIMKDGEIVESGIKDEIFNSPKNEYTKKLIEFSRLDEYVKS